MADNYEIYYSDKLWKLLPALYRAEDSDAFDRDGPLHELVKRIGVQAAILRRSLDRLWEDQSIESCDDWVIAYLADLLATNLVASLDARGQRLDVAKTIYYRRRTGTVAILEELAADITGWGVRVVEFFRRLGRTRHSLDPAIGNPATDRPLQYAQGLVGPRTRTNMGGLADLRNVYGAIQAHMAFDEFYHTADFRRGQEQVGWHNIPRLGVFLWRLRSFGLDQTTPVAVQGCPGHYTFDPTGRERPLFAAGERAYGDQWQSPAEWQLPTPISAPLWEMEAASLYATASDPNALGVFQQQGSFFDLIPPNQLTLYPERGRLKVVPPLVGQTLRVTYHYGFSARIGAGPFERRLRQHRPAPLPPPETTIQGGGDVLVAPLTTLGATGTITLADSLTYDNVVAVGGGAPIQHVIIRGDPEDATRPVIRLPIALPGGEWVFEGATDGNLLLEGLLISGGDLVLRGDFAAITLRCCTLDPGDAGVAPAIFAQAVDGRDLRPTRLWVEGQVRQLIVDRCITGPIRTRHNGAIEQLTITDSIVQSIRTADFGAFAVADLKDATRLATRLRAGADPLSLFIQSQLPAATLSALSAYDKAHLPDTALQSALIDGLNPLLTGAALYTPARFARVQLSQATKALIAQNPTGAALARLNRQLLEEGYPLELADLALATASGVVDLARCTLLGSGYVHRLSASECILDEQVLVEDEQHGCVRFSAWSSGSRLPRPYESVEVAPGSPIFTARVFAQPGYAQLLSNADRAILAGAAGATISAGAQNGAEMGAFAGEKNPIKVRSIGIKYQEFMPLGLAPVLIYVT